jgi:hypothetical protein
LSMASERQIAANRRNAQKSTGRKSQSGKTRSSKNAYRHGLSVPMSKAGSQARLQDLSRQFAGAASNAGIPALAERAADAHLELTRVRNAQTAMIERALMPYPPGARSHLASGELRHRIAQNGWRGKTQGIGLPQPERLDSSTPLPGGNAEWWSQNVVQPALLELTKMYLYEKRAAGRRDRAISQIISIKTGSKEIRI